MADPVFPMAIDPTYTCRVTDATGRSRVFDDLLREGERVGCGYIPEGSEDRDGRPPYGFVVRVPTGLMIVAEEVYRLAEAFHEEYEAASDKHGWKTQHDSRVSFDELPPANRAAMLDTIEALLDRTFILPARAAFR